MLSEEKSFAIALFSCWDLELFKWALYILSLPLSKYKNKDLYVYIYLDKIPCLQIPKRM